MWQIVPVYRILEIFCFYCGSQLWSVTFPQAENQLALIDCRRDNQVHWLYQPQRLEVVLLLAPLLQRQPRRFLFSSQYKLTVTQDKLSSFSHLVYSVDRGVDCQPLCSSEILCPVENEIAQWEHVLWGTILNTDGVIISITLCHPHLLHNDNSKQILRSDVQLCVRQWVIRL